MDKLDMHTKNLAEEKYEALKNLFPNAVTEIINENGELIKAIDKDILTQEISSEVVEGREERYQFTWPDKRNAILTANAPISKTLRPCREESVNFDETENLYIEGDNLEVLKLLQETYLDKIDVIYIDPPYNTGNDFVYNDVFKKNTEEYLEHSGQYDDDGNRLVKNQESNGRYHTDWLNMMYPRLLLSRDLLSDNGTLFVSIDDNELYNLKLLLDDIFGEENCVGSISVLTNPKGRSQDMYIAKCHEYILIYSKKSQEKGRYNIAKSVDQLKDDYKLIDDQGEYYREIELRNTHREFGKHNRPNLFYPIYAAEDGTVSLEKSERYTLEILPIWNDGYEGCWTWGKDKAKKYVHLLHARIAGQNWKVFRKDYAIKNKNASTKMVKSLWLEKVYHTEKGQAIFNNLFNNKNKIFDSPKPVELVAECIRMAKPKIVLDFFSGSSTTAHAVMQLNAEDNGNRKFIMVQLPEETDEKSEAFKAGYETIAEIGKERIRRAGKKILEENQNKEGIENLDIGFRVLKTDTSNMKDVFYGPADTEQNLLDMLEDNIKEDRSPEDLLFQVMLDLGVSLSSQIKVKSIGGKQVLMAEDNFLIACFDKDVNEETVKEIAKREPYYAVFRDVSMASDSVATNFEQIFESISPETIRRVV